MARISEQVILDIFDGVIIKYIKNIKWNQEPCSFCDKLSEGRQQQIQVFERDLGAVLKEEQGGRWRDDMVRKRAWSASWKTWVPSLEPEI